MKQTHLTHEPRGDHLTNRCIELLQNPHELILSGWRNQVEFGVAYRGPHTMETGQHENGFEFDLLLTEKPDDNHFAYEIWSKNLVFWKQPPLTEDEIKEGHQRPENVVGSYAVYHKFAQSNVRKPSGVQINYGCGKFCHIFRPKAYDADGRSTWCDMNIEAGYLVLTVPEEFLKRAKYPVIVDPNIGYAVAGASTLVANRVKTYNNMANELITQLVGAGGTVTGGSAYCALDNQSSGNTEIRMCAWRNVADPDKALSIRDAYGSSTEVSSETPSWVSANVSGTLLANESYGPGFTANKYFSSDVLLNYDSIAPFAYNGQNPGQSCTDGTTTCIPATLGTTGALTYKYSIYFTYTEDAPEGKMYLAAGWIIGNVEVRDNSFQAELRGRAQYLQQNMLELYTSGCRADLGDTRCGVDLDDSAGTYHHSGAVTSVSDDRLQFIDDSVDSSITDDVFRFGLLSWNAPESGDSWTGNNAGFQIEVKKYDVATGEFTLFQPMPYAIGVGDEFELTWGCDKSTDTCKDRYTNLVNFRGEPHIPSKSEVVTVRFTGRWPTG